MASQGPNTASTASGGSTNAWSNPTYALASDSSYATRLGVKNSVLTSGLLTITNFGFSIPTGATINGVVVAITRHANSGLVSDNTIQLYKGGSVTGTNQSGYAAWSLSDNTLSVGGSTSLWGATLSVADVNSTGFGVVLSADIDGTDGVLHTAYVNCFTMTVYYTAAPAGRYFDGVVCSQINGVACTHMDGS